MMYSRDRSLTEMQAHMEWLGRMKQMLRVDKASRVRVRAMRSIVYALLVPGGRFRKYKKKRYKTRLICCDPELTNIMWCAEEAKDKPRSLQRSLHAPVAAAPSPLLPGLPLHLL